MSTAAHEMASPNCYSNSNNNGSSSSNNFFGTKNLFKLFTKKSTKKANIDCTKRRIPLIASNSNVNVPNNLILVEVTLRRPTVTSDYGFTISGYCPCQVDKVEADSIAYKAGLLVGDLIIKINSNNVARATIPSIVKMIK